jgi:hypothetical protein
MEKAIEYKDLVSSLPVNQNEIRVNNCLIVTRNNLSWLENLS